MKIALIWAMAQNRVIGKDGDLPWRLPIDLAHFKRTTKGHAVIMGRKTWESIPGALPGRRNIVITRNADYEAKGAEVFTSLDAALDAVDKAPGVRLPGSAFPGNTLREDASPEEKTVFILGGAEIYKLALPRADELYITFVHADVEGDTHFPEFDILEWIAESHEQHEADDDNEFACAIAKMTPKPKNLKKKPPPAAPRGGSN